MNQTTPPGTARRTFDDEVRERCVQFGRDLLQLIPELESIALIPSYTIPQPQLPYVIASRNGQLQHPGEIQHLSIEVHNCLRLLLDKQWLLLQAFDQHFGEYAKQLKAQGDPPADTDNN